MATSNEELVQELIRDGYLRSPLLVGAFRAVDRKDFVPENLQSEVYVDAPLSIGEGQTISQPRTVAIMLELLKPQPGEKILDVGSGSGWTTALLAYCVSKSQIANRRSPNDKRRAISDKRGTVIAVERIQKLCRFGEENVRKYNFVEKGIVKFFCGDASRGASKKLFPERGFDKILSGAAAAVGIPEAWKEQLKIGGRIVAPVGNSVVVLDKISESKFKTKEHYGFSFVPLVEDR